MSASNGARFLALHKHFFVAPNPWDGTSAKILASLGFKALASSSAALAWTLGRKDYGVTRAEAVTHAAMIAKATGLPVNGDFEDGYGATPKDVAETIAAAIDAGIAGCSVEDLAGPGALYDAPQACRRLEAAREAIERSGEAFVLTGRCEAILAPVADAVATAKARLAAYAKAGAHVLYAPGLSDEADIAEVVAIGPPVSVIAGLGGVSSDLAALERLGVKRVTMGSQLASVAYGAMLRAAQTLADGRLDMAGALGSRRIHAAIHAADSAVATTEAPGGPNTPGA